MENHCTPEKTGRSFFIWSRCVDSAHVVTCIDCGIKFVSVKDKHWGFSPKCLPCLDAGIREEWEREYESETVYAIERRR